MTTWLGAAIIVCVVLALLLDAVEHQEIPEIDDRWVDDLLHDAEFGPSAAELAGKTPAQLEHDRQVDELVEQMMALEKIVRRP